MEKIVLSEQSKKFEKIKEYWFKTARSIKSVSDLKDFYSSLFNDYVHDYGTMVHAIGAFAVAAASLGADTMGITGFQAGFVMWDFIQNWTYTHNKTGLKIVDYDNMLYPQYDYKFDKTISPETWSALQKEAAEKLAAAGDYAHPDVVEHWRSIANGEVPFGYKVRRE